MRTVLLHYHILKNAGTTIENILDRSFGHKFRTVDTTERDGHVSTRILLRMLGREPEVRAVSSHQIRHPVPAVPGFLFFDLCIFRDPIDRIRSMYDYFREKPGAGDPVSDFANQLPLGDFVARLIQEMPWYVNDIQVNLLANGIVNDCPRRQDLELALARMLQTSFLGVVDCFTESLIAGQYFLHPIFPELDVADTADNTTGGLAGSLDQKVSRVEEACEPEVYAQLLRMNALDLELLRCARAEVQRRYRSIPEEQAAILHQREQAARTLAELKKD